METFIFLLMVTYFMRYKGILRENKLVIFFFVVMLLSVSSFSVKGESQYINWKTPENKGATLKNVIDPLNLVNLVTGEFSIQVPFPSYNGRGFSFTPVLSYNPSYTLVRSSTFQTYFGDNPEVIWRNEKLPYSSWGFGWHMSPFGYISSEKKVDEDTGEEYNEYRMVLPDGGSVKLVEYGNEYLAEGDPSVPEWNSDVGGGDVYIQEFRMESNPYFIIKRYRTYEGDFYHENLGIVKIYDNYRWYAQSPSNDKYYFDHGVYSRVPITLWRSQNAFDTPKDVALYFKEYNRWDLSRLIPHGIASNEVYFVYRDEVGYVNKVREQMFDILRICDDVLNPQNGCGSYINWYLSSDSGIPWNVQGRTEFISNSEPLGIYQPYLGGGSPKLSFVGYDRLREVYDTDFSVDFEGNGPFAIYCKNQAGYCSRDSPLVYGNDGTPYMQLHGYPSNPWGAYKKITNLEPFTTYTIKGQISVSSLNYGWAPELSDCKIGDLELSQRWNNDETPGEGFYALIKVGSFAVDNNHQFNADDAFSKSSFTYPDRAVWFAASSEWDIGSQCWSDGGSCFGGSAGIKSNLDSYIVNCFNLANSGGDMVIDFEETFTTAQETSRIVYISSYIPINEYSGQGLDIKVRNLRIYRRPAIRLITGIDYEAYQGDKMLRESYNLYYDDDPDGDGQPSLKKIQKVGYLSGEIGQDSLPPIEFGYVDSGDFNGKLIRQIKLSTGGTIYLDSYTVKENTYTKQDPWIRYYIFSPGLDTTKELTKKQLVVNSISMDDGRGNLYTITYNYDGGGWYWGDYKEAFFAPIVKVIDPLGDLVYYKFMVDTVDDENPLHGLMEYKNYYAGDMGPILYTESYSYSPYYYEGNGEIYHVRLNSENKISYDENGDNPREITTYYTNFDIVNCDSPTRIINYGFSDVPDTSVVEKFYTSIDDYKCLLDYEQTWSGEVGTILASYTDYEYYTSEGPKKGLLKRVVEKNLQLPFEDRESNLDYDDYGNVISMTDALGRTTQIIYDDSYSLYPIKYIDPLLHENMLFYDGFWRANKVKGVNNEYSYLQYDDLNRLCRYQLPGKEEPNLVEQSPGSAGPICYDQNDIHNPEPREGSGEGGPVSGPVYCWDIECDAGTWCCDIPIGEAHCIPIGESCPSDAVCDPVCQYGEGCCDRGVGDPVCVDWNVGCEPL
jgi:hypothetical protein